MPRKTFPGQNNGLDGRFLNSVCRSRQDAAKPADKKSPRKVTLNNFKQFKTNI